MIECGTLRCAWHIHVRFLSFQKPGGAMVMMKVKEMATRGIEREDGLERS